eukprot:3882806-Rhodomonas_salina.2
MGGGRRGLPVEGRQPVAMYQQISAVGTERESQNTREAADEQTSAVRSERGDPEEEGLEERECVLEREDWSRGGALRERVQECFRVFPRV